MFFVHVQNKRYYVQQRISIHNVFFIGSIGGIRTQFKSICFSLYALVGLIGKSYDSGVVGGARMQLGYKLSRLFPQRRELQPILFSMANANDRCDIRRTVLYEKILLMGIHNLLIVLRSKNAVSLSFLFLMINFWKSGRLSCMMGTCWCTVRAIILYSLKPG